MSENSRERYGLKPFDVADHLRTEDEALLYLQECFEEAGDDAAFIAQAIGTVLRAQQRMGVIAKLAGVSRESLYKGLSGDRAPNFATVLKVINALGLRLRVAKAAPTQNVESAPSSLYQASPGIDIHFADHKWRGVSQSRTTSLTLADRGFQEAAEEQGAWGTGEYNVGGVFSTAQAGLAATIAAKTTSAKQITTRSTTGSRSNVNRPERLDFGMSKFHGLN